MRRLLQGANVESTPGRIAAPANSTPWKGFCCGCSANSNLKIIKREFRTTIDVKCRYHNIMESKKKDLNCPLYYFGRLPVTHLVWL